MFCWHCTRNSPASLSFCSTAFASMFVPSLGRRFARPDFAPALREMFDRGQGDEGLVFTK